MEEKQKEISLFAGFKIWVSEKAKDFLFNNVKVKSFDLILERKSKKGLFEGKKKRKEKVRI